MSQSMVSFLFFLACDNPVCYSDIVWSENLYVYFFCFLPIFDRGFSFSFAFFRSLTENFLFLLKNICSLTLNGSSFLGDPFVPSFEGKGKNSYPRSRFIANELRFWL